MSSIMNVSLRSLVAISALLFATGAKCQNYDVSSDLLESSWAPGTWDGEEKFYDVYCLTFPEKAVAERKEEAFFNKNAVHLTSVEYPNRLLATIVVSTLPPGRTEEQERKRLLEIEHQGEKLYEHNYGISQNESAFGSVIGLSIRNVSPRGKRAPFPLVRPLLTPKDGPIQSFSSHRIFVRGPDRFEIAVLQLSPEIVTDETEKQMTDRVTKFADVMFTSLLQCTSKLPVRSANANGG